MDVQKKLDEIVATVAGARSMPMSASCVINRAELLALLEELRAALPGSLAQARELIGDREQLVAEAREEAERILESARAHRGSLISDTEVARESREEAERILAEARREAAAIRAEADDYVDSKLANFEVVLTKTRGSVERGREKLLGLGDGSRPDGTDDPDAAALPGPGDGPDARRRGADAYVDAKLGAVSAVLAKTLEAVGRGRENLLGARPTDALGALAGQEAPAVGHPTSDADFLAGLAESPAQDGPPAPEYAGYRPPAPAYPPQEPQGPQGAHEPQQQGAYAWQQFPQQADPYAAGGYGQQADPYAWQGGAQGYGAYPQQQGREPEGQQAPRAGGALDETSFFDTGMIDLEQLRRYEQGR
ncbi:cell division initiation protein [Streptomyces caatingaensis]|uniref:Cell division initiation protein n=1 Tax=Streptomyces caatingaensis TaxID=1678637 RepID=A0A0K9XCJ3_9ACTN|nr:cell division initiation protein [Streptomyces caatingaensis]KNB51124.1 cell division initiation protein [Streptomyces caatingaensis]